MAQFRAKARAVDLLGKGQIADLPTAISELWKNGYDAYGDNLQSYLYMPGYLSNAHPIFVLTDDGKGMSKEDILDKWFVLGTDSKSRREKDIKGENTLFKEPREKMGEKGIGRLAVAYLGPQMLMITKKMNNFLEIVFFDWRILENLELFIEDINIPTRTIENIESVHNHFNDLKNEFLLNFPVIVPGAKDPWKDQQFLKSLIMQDCKELELPQFIIDEQINDLIIDPVKAHSTKFIIFKPDTQILDIKNSSKKDELLDLKDNYSVKHTISTLVALFNLFKTEKPETTTAFWIIDESGKYDLLKSATFFTPSDFESCDHLIKGAFDEYGTFTGDVRIYKKTIKHSFKQVQKIAKSSYGPFSIQLGYLMGVKDQSLLDDEQFSLFDRKLDIFSGLYIYRDGFRVLPYGRSDNDFLEFEERRGKHAGEFFFAKRRMFGYIEISRGINIGLTDKSSREGFINNVAYRDFKTNLIAFFIDLAKKYFGTNAETDYKEIQREELKKLADAEEKEKQRDLEARKIFTKQLKEYPENLKSIQDTYKNLISDLNEKAKAADVTFNEISELLNNIEGCKILIEDYNISKPVRYTPTPLQEKNFYAYVKQYNVFQKEIFETESIIDSARSKLKTHELFKEFSAKHELFLNTLSNQFHDFDNQLKLLSNKFMLELHEEQNYFIRDFEEKYNAIIPAETDISDINQSIKLLESVFNETRKNISNRVTPYLSHLEKLSFDINEDDLVGFYKKQFEEMKDEWNKTYELAQLGIAVEIIDHQFNTLYSQLSENIRSLKQDLPISIQDTKYNLLLNAFNHLEDNYKLLQPLYRTTGRIRKDITGLELYEYAFSFFGDRLKQNNIEFIITPEASAWKEFSYESIFKPVLINIINNAIYWLQPVNKKQIIIDTANGDLLIMNSGLEVEDHLLEDIFKLFYSARPKGRGIGLYLAKKSLNGIGYDIYATNKSEYNRLNGACFVITSTPKP